MKTAAQTIPLPLHPDAMTAKNWGVLLLLSLIWGSSFFFIKIGVTWLPPMTLVFCRSFIAALALFVILKASRLSLPRGRAAWRQFAFLGFINNLIPFSLIFWAQTIIPSSLAAILNATVPLWGVLLTHYFCRERASGAMLAGCLAGFAGVAILIGLETTGFSLESLAAEAAVLGAALAYAASSIYARRFKSYSPLVSSASQMTATSVMVLPIALFLDHPWTLSPPPVQVVLAVLALGILCTAVAYILYFRLLNSAGSINVLLVTFLMPVMALFLGIVFLEETLAPSDFAGMLFITIGLAAIDGRLLKKIKAV